jgi:hypothetical protein
MDSLNLNEINLLVKDLQDEKLKNKLSMNISTDYALTDYLNMLTKPELCEIAKRIKVKGYSNLNKGELVEVLNNEIKNNLVNILKRITEKEFYFLLIVIPKEGITLININDESQRKLVTNLREWGIVFSGTLKDLGTFAVIPKDLLPEMKAKIEDEDIATLISERQKVTRAASGLLYYYGVMKDSELYDNVKSLLEIDMDYNSLAETIDNSSKYGETIRKQGDLYYYYKVLNPEYIYAEQLKRESLVNMPFDIKQVFHAGVEGYSEWSEPHSELLTHLMSFHNVKREDAQRLVEQCINLVRNDYKLEDIVEAFKKFLNISDYFEIEELQKQIKKVKNNTPLWILKGYTYNEAYKNVGRNDLCVCGSGKKYKKCCGMYE